MSLAAQLVPVGTPPVVSVTLRWSPVANATCIGIELRSPFTGGWVGLTGAAGYAEDLPGLGVSEPGSNCFRIFAGNQAGRSGYSNETCVDVPGAHVTYPAGWNLISLPTGETRLTNVDGPLYTYKPGDTAYQVVPNDAVLSGGNYWAYFDAPATETFPAEPSVQSLLNVQADQWTLIGNPSALKPVGVSAVSVNGVPTTASFYVYDPTNGRYEETMTLQPGQAAWVYSASGGLIGIG